MSKEKYIKWNKRLQAGCMLIGAAYIYLLMKIVFFKYMTPAQLLQFGINTNLRGVSLNPLADLITFFDGHMTILTFTKNFIGNIGLFIPMGMILPVLFPGIKHKNVVITGVVCSLCIEGIQYIFGLGVTDTTDVMLNTLGAALGAYLYETIEKHCKHRMQVRIVIIISLVILGVSGVMGIYYTQASLLFHAKTVVKNIEVLQGLDPQMSDDCGKLGGFSSGKITLTIPSYTDQEGNTVDAVNTEYSVSEDLKICQMEETYKYAGNSLIKTTQSYRVLSQEDAERLIESNNEENSLIFADVWLKDEKVEAILLNFYPVN